jgi:hypothetical protein
VTHDLHLINGKEYDFETTDGTVYEDSIYLYADEDGGGIWIRTGRSLPVQVFIADHELKAAHNAFGSITVAHSPREANNA